MTLEEKVNALDKKDFAILYCMVYLTDYPLNYQQLQNANAIFQLIFNEFRVFTPADRTQLFEHVRNSLRKRTEEENNLIDKLETSLR